jgi:hypothetical protein
MKHGAGSLSHNLFDVTRVELSACRVLGAREQAFSLLLLRDVQNHLEDAPLSSSATSASNRLMSRTGHRAA